MATDIVEKICSCCHISKPLTEFNKSATGKFGVNHYCRVCLAIRYHTPHEPESAPLDLPDEVWKPCVENTKYAVSNLGRVKRIAGGVGVRAPERLLSTKGIVHGYPVVNLGAKNAHAVHRLVCHAFHGEPPTPEHEVNHIDHDRQNNRAENLEWVTSKENTQWCVQAGRNARGERNGIAKLTDDKVRAIFRIKREQGLSNIAISKLFHVVPQTIDRVINREIWKHVNVEDEI